MSGTAGFDYTHLFSKGVPEPAARWKGYVKHHFVGGNNDPTQIPIEGLLEAAASVLRREGSRLALYNLGYGPMGYPGLRDFVADKVGRHRGIKCTRDDVMVLSGSGQGIELLSRMFTEPGDTVLLEEASYGGAISRHKRVGAKVVGVPVDHDGIVPEALANVLDTLKAKGIVPKYLYTIPTIQNPTGSIMPLERRKQVLDIVRQHGVPIFEDECYADLIWGGPTAPPAYYALSPSQVFHIGSFSKTLAPALRLGYAIGDYSVIGRMAAMKTDGGTGALDQMITAEYFSKFFDKHVDALSAVLKEKLDTMVDALEKEFGTAVELWQPKGGIFLWLKLPDAVDVRTLVKPAKDASIEFNPGPEWSCTPDNNTSYMRLCFATPTKQEIRDGVAALAKVCFEQTGIPAQSANVRHAKAS